MTSASTLDLSPIHPISENFSGNATLRRCASSGNVKHAKYETAFGPENRTITRVYYKNGVATDYSYQEDEDSLHKTPVETHFESYIGDELLVPLVDDKSQCNYDTNFSRVRSMRQKKTENRYKKEEAKRRRSYGYSVAAVSVPNDPENKGSTWSGYSQNDNDQRITGKPPPSYNSLFPENHQPVIGGRQKHRSLPRSKSSHSLHSVQAGCTLPGYRSRERLDSAPQMIDKPLRRSCPMESTESLSWSQPQHDRFTAWPGWRSRPIEKGTQLWRLVPGLCESKPLV